MQPRDPFLNLSPLDHRYWQANAHLFDSLAETLSERAAVRYSVRAEAALLTVHIRRHLGGRRDFLDAAGQLEERVSPEDVSREEEITRHNVRALVNVIQRHLPGELAPWVHLGATSVDILDTAMAMRIRDALRGTVIPLLLDLLDALTAITREHAHTPQAGRTHGQMAVPVTFGFATAEYVSRLGQSIERIHHLSGALKGKLSGAVGAYNALSLITDDPEAFEAEYLELLGLTRADYANQIVEPEHLLRLLLEINIAFGVIANLADDLRHLQRSEIAEAAESFGGGQVGSSTMPQKRNPWNSEHVKSLWKAFSPRALTFFMDQISEHQRDLSNSASGRFVTDYIAGFTAAAARMKGVLLGLQVNAERMAHNLRTLGGGTGAEPAYILLALSGRGNAHETVREAALKADSSGRPLMDVLREDRETWNTISERLEGVLGASAEEFYADPSMYRGLAARRALELAEKYSGLRGSLEMKNGG